MAEPELPVLPPNDTATASASPLFAVPVVLDELVAPPESPPVPESPEMAVPLDRA